MSEMLRPQSPGIPLPVPTLYSQPYWDGCRIGELRYQRCRHCGVITMDPAPACSGCFSSDLSWEVSTGLGEVYSWTTVWRPQTPAFTVPYVAVIVELDEGFWLLSNLVGCAVDAVHVGMRVSVTFVEMSDEITLPYFEPVGGSSP
ncbi:Zn-ribbon domain-containing OB-fold protein [Candidatus Poriferisocius sp.]|uniref:Zn-ribbon domain-containing OB-fold protein n=1 Tax=Candidatus Poriferisocius sp. TaxID=3101276 RepID=UPI003B011AB4